MGIKYHSLRVLIDDQAQKHPDAIYIVFPEINVSISYKQLQQYLKSISGHLAYLGLKKGDVVACMFNNGCASSLLFLGAMYGGFVPLMINLVAGAANQIYVIEHSEAKLILTDTKFSEDVKALLKEMSFTPICKNIDPNTIPFNSFNHVCPDDISSPNDTALLMYTSGTTGRPKGVMLSHQNIIAAGQYTSMAHALNDKDIALCVLPLYHINAQMVTIMAPLYSGGKVVMPPRFSASLFWSWIDTYRCTWFSVVPTIISHLLNTDYKNNDKPSSLKFGRSASSALSPEVHKRFEEKFGVSIIETMGLTETSAQILSNPIDPSKRKYGSPGIAYGNAVNIVDEKGAVVPPLQKGEIVVKGENVMKGYFKQPDMTKETFFEDGWLKTGDIGYIDEDGFFFVIGRIKELIIKGGENISPREIDEVLYKIPAIVEAACFGVDDQTYGQHIEMAIVLKEGTHYTKNEIFDFCKQHLHKFKMPNDIHFLSELPKGPSGKIQRSKIVDIVYPKD